MYHKIEDQEYPRKELNNMAINIERLLRLTADYHNFCSEDYAKANSSDPDELSMDDLDFVAAAAAVPMEEQDADKTPEKLIP